MANDTTSTIDTTITNADSNMGKKLGEESSLSNWAGPYVTNMLGQGAALGDLEYQAYDGPFTAGESAAQTAAFQGIGNLAVPTDQMGTYNPQSFTADQAQNYMNPYLMTALQPQIDEATRLSQIQRTADAGRMTKSGAYGGSRQAIMDSELTRGLLANLADITGTGYKNAYDRAMDQFNTEEDRAKGAQADINRYGLDALTKQANLGAEQRGIEQEGITADYEQFKEERDYPYKAVTYQQSLLQGLPLEAQSYTYQQQNELSEIMNLLGGSAEGIGLLAEIFGIDLSGNAGAETGGAETGTELPENPYTSSDEDIAGGAPE